MSADKPLLRPLEIFPFHDGGRNLVCLRDPTGIAPEPVFIDEDTFFIVSLFDGRHTVLDIQQVYVQRFGALLFSDRVRAVVRELDDHRLLESPEFEIFRDALVEEFAAAPVRPLPEELSYPRDPVALASLLASILTPKRPVDDARGDATLAALIAPHIDYDRGRQAYACAFREVAPLSAPQLVLVLGTSHAPARNRFILTRKHFATPFGRTATDVEFVETLARKLPFDPFADEFNHRNEHSIELQAVFLKYLLREPGALAIVPVLCGSLTDIVAAGASPADDPQVRAFYVRYMHLCADLHWNGVEKGEGRGDAADGPAPGASVRGRARSRSRPSAARSRRLRSGWRPARGRSLDRRARGRGGHSARPSAL